MRRPGRSSRTPQLQLSDAAGFELKSLHEEEEEASLQSSPH